MTRSRAPPPPKFKDFNRKQSRLGALCDRVTSFDVGALFAQARPLAQPRTIFINEPLPAEYFDKKGRVTKDHTYPTNQVITSKYTILIFLPRNLLEQFRRIANIFFLGIAIMQFFPEFTTTNPFLQLLPLLIVLGMTAAKDGYEDVKRHQSDREVNHTQVRVLSSEQWTNANASEAKQRTFVRALVPRRKKSRKAADAAGGSDDEDVEEGSAGGAKWVHKSWEDVRVGDVIKVHQDESLPADILICATSEEENMAYVETKNLDGETSLKSRGAVPALSHLRRSHEWVTSPPVRIECDRPEANMYKVNAAVITSNGRAPVDVQMTLLRGTVLRNTDWVVGVVMFTGADTKVVLNSGATPSKRSKVEREMNPQVAFNLLLLLAMAVVCGIANSLQEQYYYDRNALWMWGANQGDDNPQINGLIAWAFAVIIFHNLIPISLYISIEAVRTVQAAFIYFDHNIYYAARNQPTLARSWNLADDLGQIEYIFSDKTGTLTQNLMVFRRCSVAGQTYGAMPIEGDNIDDDESFQNKPPKDNAAIELAEVASSAASITTSSAGSTSTEGSSPSFKSHIVFADAQLAADVSSAAEALRAAPGADLDGDGAPDLARARTLEGFFTVLALCHTVLSADDTKTGKREYRAQSPDEAALVQAAADAGFVFLGREREVLRLRTPLADGTQEFQLLNILEFSSARKRMSVVVRAPGGRLLLLSKGADSVIFERLREGDEELRAGTEAHLDEFANDGLRTLTLAYKELDESAYQGWNSRYEEAATSLDAREEKLDDLAEELERGLVLLGATAIEDKLQDGVPETIADLRRAGIKIWVATGDKLETAVAIGYSTNLIPKDANVAVVRGDSPVYEQMLRSLRARFPDAQIPDVGDADPNSLEAGLAANTSNNGLFPVEAVEGDLYAPTVLVIDGAALTHALADDRHKVLFLTLSTRCASVVCCRVSPMQKALVTKLVREALGVMTLAIGDGANDVSMIQAADVGVGISGEEGMQAVNSADYAIAQFRFLKRLLLVHGHWSYSRNGQMIVNFFYKNVVPNGVLWWFQIYASWSAAVGFEYTSLLFWNSLWTIAPVVAMGIFDRVADDDVLMAMPELYHFGRQGYWFNFRVFALYMLEAVYQSTVIFFFARYTYDTTSTRGDGYAVYIHEWSSTMFIAAVMIANLFMGINTHVWTVWVFGSVALGIAMIWMFFGIYNSIPPSDSVTLLWGNNHLLFTSPYFWLTLALVIVLALAPRLLGKAIKACWFPDDLDIMRYVRKTDPHRTFVLQAEALRSGSSPSLKPVDTRISAASRLTYNGRLSGARTPRRRDHGFDFSQEEHGVAIRRMQTNLSERDVPPTREAKSSKVPMRKKGSAMFASLTKGMRRSRLSIPDRAEQP